LTDLPDTDTFVISEAETRRMRRGALLFPVLVLPFVLVLGLDQSKSQPAHFLIILAIGTLASVVLIAIARAGVLAQIETARSTTLRVSADRLTWSGPAGRSELMLSSVRSVRVATRFGNVRAIRLHSSNSQTTTLQGYERMNALLMLLRTHLKPELFNTRNAAHGKG
jgi:hypothetical protein